MSLYLGHWAVSGVNPAGEWVCRCPCSAVNLVAPAALDENLVCSACGDRPLLLQRDERTDDAQQLDFGSHT
jgi:hypothetical protein